MHFPSDTKNNNNAPSNGVKTNRKINFSTIFLFNHKKTLFNLTKNVKFLSRIQTFFCDLYVEVFSNSPTDIFL